METETTKTNRAGCVASESPNESAPAPGNGKPLKRKRRKQRALQAGSGRRGLGSIFQSTYRDRETGQRMTARTFAISYHNEGLQVREYGFATEEIARAVLEKRLKEVAAGTALPQELRKITLRDLTDLVISDYERENRRSLKRATEGIAHLHEGFGADHLAVEINGNRVEEYIADRLASFSRHRRHPANGTINRELALLRHAFNLGAQADPPLVQKVPRVKMLAEATPRSGFFEVDQFNRIVAELPEYLHAPLEVARITGWRIASEVITRKVKHLDLSTGWLRLDPGETKNGEGREFPLTPQLRAVLEAQRARTRALERERGEIIPHLFHDDEGKPIGNFRGWWKSACKRAGVKRLLHDLRRTAIRNFERAGIPRSAAMAMCGHRTESVYRRYAIADSVVLKEAAIKLAALQANEAAESDVSATRAAQ